MSGKLACLPANLTKSVFAAAIVCSLTIAAVPAFAQKHGGGGGHETGAESGGCSGGGCGGDEGGSEGHEGGSKGHKGARGGPGGVAGPGGRGQSLRDVFHGLDPGSTSEGHSGSEGRPH